MTEARISGRTVTIAAVTVGLLAGCSSSHVDEEWQCPMTQGELCTRVEAADPAVPKTAQPGRPAHRHGQENMEGSDCAETCGPLGWFGRLFGIGETDTASREIAAPGEPAEPGVGIAVQPLPEIADTPAQETAAPVDAATSGLRAPETVARVWIAPFVDGDGLYREASWVRVVLAPAHWQQP